MADPLFPGPLFSAATSRSRINWAYIILLLVLLLTSVATWSVQQLVVGQQRARFLREADGLSQAVQQRLDAYIEVMLATRGLWGLGPVDRDGFARYVDSLELQRRYPGIQGLGYAEIVPRAARAAFEARLRAAGALDYRVRPAADARPYAVPVTYIEPRDAANLYALGFDMASEARRREAIERALTTGNPAATARVVLVQEERDANPQGGFLIYLPIYREGFSLRTEAERRAAIQGFVYAPFLMRDFLANTADRGRYGEASFELRDAGEPLFGASLANAAFRTTRVLQVGGRTWQLTVTATPAFGRDPLNATPWVTLAMGLTIAALAFWAAQGQVLARRRAEDMSARLARSRASLDVQRAEFAAIFRAMHDAAVFADPQGHVRLANDATRRTFGFEEGELAGQRLGTLHVGDTVRDPHDDGRVTGRFRRKDGSEFVGEAQRSLVRSETGEVIGQLEVVRDMTAQRAAEQALRDSELRYRGVLEAMPQLVWVTDPEGKHLYYNQGWYDFTGLGREESLDYGFATALHPDDVDRTLKQWERSWRHGEPYEIEYRFRRFDGEYHWFVGRAKPIRDAEGRVIEWVGTCTDIHEQKTFEETIKREGARYRGLIEGMPQIVWVARPDGQATYYNRRWFEYVGEDAWTKRFLAFVHPDDRGHFEQAWDTAVESQEPYYAEYRLRRFDGQYRAFIARGLPVRSPGGEIIEWVGTCTDVEDQVYAEAAARLLAELGRLYARPLREADGPIARDAQPTLDRLAPRFSRTASAWLVRGDGFDVRRAGVGNEAVARRAETEALVERVITSGVAETFEDAAALGPLGLGGALAVPLVARGDQSFGALLLGYEAAPSGRDLDLAHEVASRLAAALDNERLFHQTAEARRELAELNATLEQRVEQRTAELQEANRELEAFSYSVSHDLRTPLRHIVGFGDLLRKDLGDKLDAKSNRYLGIMTDAATRMSTLIDDLLNFSRMGRQEMRLAPVELGDLLDEVQAELAPELAGRDVRWEVGPLPRVSGDAALLKLVLVNLISNALKYSRGREPSVVSIQGRTEGGEAIVEVRDNGVGFDARFADKLFGVFQRLHRAEEFEGVGIGLANVRRIVSRHGGRVWASSTLGEGATFSFSLPLAPDPAPTAPSPSAPNQKGPA